MTWSCRCGQMTADIVTGRGWHFVCYCKDCQAAAHHLGAAGILDEHGGTEVYQTQPDRYTITSGAEYLKLLRLSPKGALRFYAGCCDSPFAMVIPNPQLPFASVLTYGFAELDALGPIEAYLYTDEATGPVPHPATPAGPFMRRVLWSTLVARLGGHHRPTPFFRDDGTLVSVPRVLSVDERAAATP